MKLFVLIRDTHLPSITEEICIKTRVILTTLSRITTPLFASSPNLPRLTTVEPPHS
jgi:hypothetical protein